LREWTQDLEDVEDMERCFRWKLLVKKGGDMFKAAWQMAVPSDNWGERTMTLFVKAK